VLQPNNYAKQTQFQKRQNGPKLLQTHGLRKSATSRTAKKQTQSCSTPEIHPQPIHAGPPANLRHLRPKSIKAQHVSSKLPKTPQKPRVFLIFSHIFAVFRAFSRVSNTQSARLCRITPQSARTRSFVSIFFFPTPRNCPETNPPKPPGKKFPCLSCPPTPYFNAIRPIQSPFFNPIPNFPSTTPPKSAQSTPFPPDQNPPNSTFPKAKMNLTFYRTKNYENRTLLRIRATMKKQALGSPN